MQSFEESLEALAGVLVFVQLKFHLRQRFCCGVDCCYCLRRNHVITLSRTPDRRLLEDRISDGFARVALRQVRFQHVLHLRGRTVRWQEHFWGALHAGIVTLRQEGGEVIVSAEELDYRVQPAQVLAVVHSLQRRHVD